MILRTTFFLAPLVVLLGSQFVSAITGDTQCTRQMCVSAFVNDTDVVTYKLTVSTPQLGWAALGFGTRMTNSPMVIMWIDSTGNTTISQRQASQYVEPQVVAQPPRVATAYENLKSLTTASTSLSFTIPANSDTRQNIIWAYSTVSPTSSGGLVEHDDKDTMTLNLAGQLGSDGSPSGDSGSGGSEVTIPLDSSSRLYLAHGAVLATAFLFILPFGGLVARLLRTFTITWFRAHWILQGLIAAPLIVAGWAIAVYQTQAEGKPHFAAQGPSNIHKQLGLAIFVLYVVQVVFGIVIHYVKSPNRIRRPVQNYAHAILGLAILGLAFYQVYTGFSAAWPNATGIPTKAVYRTFWIAWVIILSAAYFVGLALLPRQYRQERQAVEGRRKGVTRDGTEEQ